MHREPQFATVAVMAFVLSCASGPSAEEVVVTLPDAPPGRIFAVVNVGAAGVSGRVGSVEALEGPNVRVTDPGDIYVLTFPGGLFGGYRGPDQIQESTADEREGLDAVRITAPLDTYQWNGTTFEATSSFDSALADNLRVPCDTRTAATRPAFEVDPDPRCPSGSRALQALVSCQDLMSSSPQQRTLVTATEMFDVNLEQRGCRVDMTCAADASCPSWLPMFSVRPPRLAAEGDEALTSFASTSRRSALCRQGDDGTYTCPDGSTFRIE